MPLEPDIDENSTPEDLNPDWPTGADPKNEGDNHLRNVKLVMQNFYGQFSFVSLADGAIPSVYGRETEPSGLYAERGGVIAPVRVVLREGFHLNPVDSLPSPLVYTPIGADQRPVAQVSSDPITILTQPTDTETNTGPVAYPITTVNTGFLTAFKVRGAGTAVANCRMTFREGGAGGPILAQTASDLELKGGNGVTIAATGDTLFSLPEYWSIQSGTNAWITFERWDDVGEEITGLGIELKGVVIDSYFRPWAESTYYPSEFKDIALLEDLSGGASKLYHVENVNAPFAGTGATGVLSHIFTDVEVGVYLCTVTAWISSPDGASNGATAWRLQATMNGVVEDIDGLGNILSDDCSLPNIPKTSNAIYGYNQTNPAPTDVTVAISASSYDPGDTGTVIRIVLELDKVE